jgi:integrase
LQGIVILLHMPAKSTGSLRKWEHPKKSGIWIREIVYSQTFNGKQGIYSAFQVTVPNKITDAGRKRKQFKEKTEAQRWASDKFVGSRKQGKDYFKATDKERREFIEWIPKLRESDIHLGEALAFALKHMKPAGGERTVGQVVEELVASKKMRFQRGDLRERSFTDFRNRANRFGKAFEELPVKELHLDSITDWLLDLELEPRTTKNYLTVIVEVLSDAFQKEYIAESPLVRLTTNKRKELIGTANASHPPSLLTPKEARRLLEGALRHPKLDLLGTVVLGLLCGIRVGELQRLDWDLVKLDTDNPFVTIPATMAKKRSIRNVEIPQNALRWLSLVPKRSGLIIKVNNDEAYRLKFNRLLQLSGFGKKSSSGDWESDWKTNAMRHSFGSYHYALHGNPLETSRQLGHKSSDQVLFDHYRALATKEQGEAFFSIVPPKSESKLVEFAG